MIWILLAAATNLSGGTWITQDDYPVVALQNRHEGAVAVELTVDPSGALANCRVVASSGWDELDEASCAIVRKRARYAPATDDKGAPIAFVYRLRFVWALAKSSLPASGPNADNELDIQVKAFPKSLTQPAASLLFTVGTNGKAEQCDVQRSSGSPALDRATCTALTASQSFTPPLDSHGQPMRFLRAQKVGFSLESPTDGRAPFTLAWQVNDGNRVFGCHAVTANADPDAVRDACRQIATRYHWTAGSFTSVYPPPSIAPSPQ